MMVLDTQFLGVWCNISFCGLWALEFVGFWCNFGWDCVALISFLGVRL